MGHHTKLIAVILLTSCIIKSNKQTIENVPKNSILTTITLLDSLGTVSFYLPTRFDTTLIWTNRSDCGKPCDHEQYRYQSKKFPIFMESGFYYDIPDIPVDNFTIVHSSYFPFHNSDTSKNIGRHENFKNRLTSATYKGEMQSDTLEKINDRYFLIVFIVGFDKERQKHFAKVAALTTIKSNEIEFHYDLRKKDAINLKEFYENSIKLLRTVSLSNGI